MISSNLDWRGGIWIIWQNANRKRDQTEVGKQIEGSRGGLRHLSDGTRNGNQVWPTNTKTKKRNHTFSADKNAYYDKSFAIDFTVREKFCSIRKLFSMIVLRGHFGWGKSIKVKNQISLNLARAAPSAGLFIYSFLFNGRFSVRKTWEGEFINWTRSSHRKETCGQNKVDNIAQREDVKTFFFPRQSW